MANIVITGVTGFVGKYLVLQALANGHTVFALGRDQKTLEHVRKNIPDHLQHLVHFVALEIIPENTTLLENLFVAHQINSVIHAAGQASVGQSYAEIEKQQELYAKDPNVVRNTPTGISNIQTVEVLLNALKTLETKPHFHLVSTGDVFSQESNDIIHEQADRKANTPYGWTKQFAEMLIDKAVSDGYLTASISYGPLIFGPQQRPIALLPIISEQFIKGQQVTLRGDPLRETDAIDVRDFSKIVIKASTKAHTQTRDLERYVISGHRTTMKEIFDLVAVHVKKYMPEHPVDYMVNRNYITPSDKKVDDSHARASFPDVYTTLIPLSQTIEDVVTDVISKNKMVTDDVPINKAAFFKPAINPSVTRPQLGEDLLRHQTISGFQ